MGSKKEGAPEISPFLAEVIDWLAMVPVNERGDIKRKK
jgi:hypothetical protein